MKRINRERVIFEMNKENEPVETAQSGETIIFETLDCFSGTVQSENDTLSDIDFSKVNPATGPLYVQGAEVGDTLKVTINQITIENRGAVLTAPGLGLLADGIEAEETAIAEVTEDATHYKGFEIPLRKMVGVIGTAPAGEGVNTGTPHDHGGNLDTTLIGEGASLYLPVNVEGALLSMGDMHSSMGEGEIMGSGLEVAGEVEVINLAKEYHLDVVLVSSIAHYSNEIHPDFVQMVYVEKGSDMADFKIVQLAKKGDIIITQDYGLASLLLPKGCHVLHHKGREYTNENIDTLLQSRHLSALQRKSGQRTKGPKPFTPEDRANFKHFLQQFLEKLHEE